jgi:SAM-dependent methyltransferase
MENAQHSAVHLVEGDFFNLELLPLEYFDFIYSLGFIEHFVESATVTRRMAQVLRPAGMAMTLVPNFTALYGTIQKAVNPETYNKHVVMDCKMLDEVHSGAGLTPLMPADWFGSFGPGVVDYGVLQRFIIPPLKLAQHATCWALHFLRLDGESRWASPYVVGVYQKTA